MYKLNYIFIFIIAFFIENSDARESLDNSPVEIKVLVGSVNTKNLTAEIAVEFKLQAGWHIYYKDPGDLGMPTSITVKGDLTSSSIYWPKPIVHHTKVGKDRFKSNIYENTVVFPIQVKLAPKGGKIELKIDYAACKDSCIPSNKKIILDIPFNDDTNQEVVNLITLWKTK